MARIARIARSGDARRQGVATLADLGPAGGPSMIFKALGDPVRWSIVCQAADVEELGCSILEDTLHISKPAISYHTKILVQAGLLAARKEGRNFYYALRRDVLRALGEDAWALTPGPRASDSRPSDPQAPDSRASDSRASDSRASDSRAHDCLASDCLASDCLASDSQAAAERRAESPAELMMIAESEVALLTW
jgi:DNA-binding transcriptional ArsR family regulator